jgi:ABC-type transport system substrate-binding protein
VPGTLYAELNVTRPPFDDLRVRRALNLAIDRAHLVALLGGAESATKTCQLLPPGLAGYRPICPFTASPSASGAWTAPDLARATRLIAASGTRGIAVTVLGWRFHRKIARYLVDLLRKLGFRSHAAELGPSSFDPDRWRGAHPVLLAIAGWVADSPQAAGFLEGIVGCGNRNNVSGFCDRGIDAAIAHAQTAGGDAGVAWQAVERRIAREAPVVPLQNPREVVITARRAGNVQFHPFDGVLLDRIWVR